MLLNGESSNWSQNKVRVLQGSILEPFFLAYVNDLPEGLTTNAKVFADDTSLFKAVHDSAASSLSLNDGIIFSRKASTANHGIIYFIINVPVINGNIQKYLDLFPDFKLTCLKHIYRSQCYKKNELFDHVLPCWQ